MRVLSLLLGSNRKKIQIFLFALLICLHVLSNVNWFCNKPPNVYCHGKAWQGHLRHFSFLVNRADWGESHHVFAKEQSKAANLFFVTPFYPPLYYYSAFVLRSLFGWISPEVILLTSTLYFALLLLYVYKLSELLLPRSGLLSAAMCSLLPGIYNNSRVFNPVMAVCAMVVVGIYYLLKTGKFSSRRYSVVFGFCAGVGMLIKYNVFVFLFPALCVIVLSSFFGKEQSGSRGIRVKNLLISIMLSLSIAGVFYFHPENVRLLVNRIFNWSSYTVPGVGNLSLMERVSFYAVSLWNDSGGFWGGIFIFTGFVGFSRLKAVNKRFLMFSILCSFVIVALVPKHPPFPEYILPIAPLFVIAAVCGLITNNILISRLKWAGVVMILIGLAVMHVNPVVDIPKFRFSVNNIQPFFASIGDQNNRVGFIAENDHDENEELLQSFCIT